MMLDPRILLAIEAQLDKLVQRAERCVMDTKAAQSSTQETQFRNLQNLAAATDSVLALGNFISYQIGRKYMDANVGRKILEDIDELTRLADEICSRLGLADESQKRRTRMELIRLYLGFLARKLVAERRG
ncbi:MAG: hypothetical protein N0A16_13150 [Blastocatellia bacterium]|nr:hypothetical protein [Candidatus Kapabacteria bacterium]MCS7158655.1 hypothetical protein [Blastocatellia bacterium]MDW8166904.1 hypothetical protein [Acidobacteriota bacterium]MDW8226135.1 hypothetical protein [Bacteroidota bacterium]